MSDKKIAIVGQGYIGGSFSRFVEARDVDATVTSRVLDGPGIYHDVEALERKFEGRDVVYNFVGTSRRHEETYDRVNRDTAKTIAKACKRAGVKRLVYLSGLGVEHVGDSRHPLIQNDYFRSLAAAEEAIRKSGVPFTFFRASYVVGRGDSFSNYIKDSITEDGFVRVFAMGVDATPGLGLEHLQPIYIDDSNEVFLRTADFPHTENKAFDLVGPEKITFRDYAQAVADFWFGHHEDVAFRTTSKQEAVERFGISPERIDIRMCDEVGDHKTLQHAFDIQLKTPREFLQKMFARR